LPVGTVTKVSPGHEMFLNIAVKPAADLSRLEEVLVVTEKQERDQATENTGRVRAADILAQRLPSVPDKPPDAAAAGLTANKTAMTAPPQTAVKPQSSAASSPVEPDSAQQTDAMPKTATETATKSTTVNGMAVRAVSSQATPISGAPVNTTKKAAPNTSPGVSNSGIEQGGSTGKATNATNPPQNATARPKPNASPSTSQQPPSDDDPH
jgi:hypothetical protein